MKRKMSKQLMAGSSGGFEAASGEASPSRRRGAQPTRPSSDDQEAPPR